MRKDVRALHSFAILAYKESPHLEDCIRSLIAQTTESTLYISTSTPNEMIDAVAAKYQLPVLANADPGGIGPDWQFAVSQCHTPYLTLAHQDDLYHPGYAAEMLDAMQKAGDSLIGFCDYEELVGDSIRYNTFMLRVKRLLLWPYWFKHALHSRFGRRLLLRFGSAICCPSVTYHLPKTGPLCFDTEYKCDLDWDAWVRLSALKGSFVYVSKPLMAHRIHDASATTELLQNKARMQEDYRMFCRLWPRWIAKILVRLYSLSYKSNQVP